jgi:hypothetical protein
MKIRTNDHRQKQDKLQNYKVTTVERQILNQYWHSVNSKILSILIQTV